MQKSVMSIQMLIVVSNSKEGKMGRIFAIGGGELRNGEIFEIHKAIVQAVTSYNPKLLFIPTASDDAPGYSDSVRKEFGDLLGCVVDVLELIEGYDDDTMIRKRIMDSDVIYVGGGNTKKMMEIWKKHKVDDYLREAYNKGIILSGLSAGAICWFDLGQSDSDTNASGLTQPYSLVEGIGLIPLMLCPHYDEGDREEDFDKKIMESSLKGIALANNCAIEVLEDGYRIIKSKEAAKAFHVYVDSGKMYETITTYYHVITNCFCTIFINLRFILKPRV
jgi:dipeptidase E